MTESASSAATHRFFHWPLEFPELFHDEQGRPLDAPGFDAVLGNPPWEMLRGDQGPAQTRADARLAGSASAFFVRGSGIYRLQANGHVNLYQLFVERTLSLVRPDGRLGLILPSGFAIDHGCASLRRALFDRTRVDTLHGFENRDGVFPIHRGLKFLLTHQYRRGTTTQFRHVSVCVARSPRRAAGHGRRPAVRTGLAPLARAALGSTGGGAGSPQTSHLEIVSTIAFSFPALSDAEGWRVTFGRELNATDDRGTSCRAVQAFR